MKKKPNKSLHLFALLSNFEYTTSFLIFVVVFIYLVIQVAVMVFSPSLKSYEVQATNLKDYSSYTGLVFREEQLITANQAGYVQQFYPENSRVSNGTTVSVVSQTPVQQAQVASAQPITINKLTRAQLLQHIHNFADHYTASNFQDTYTLYDSLYSTLYQGQELLRAQELEALYASQDTNNGVYKANVAGIINYTVDGFEGITLDAFQEEMMQFSNLNNKIMSSGAQVEANQPLYKLITSETWSVVIKLTPEDLSKLQDKNQVAVQFIKDNEVMNAGITLLEGDKATYAILEFQAGMVRYASQRILDVKIIHTSVEGLEIPKSAVTKAEFYAVPIEYFADKESDSPNKLLIKGKSNVAQQQFQSVKKDSEFIYFSKDVLSKGTVLIKPESDETLTLKKTVTLPIVYNINRGYANLRCITIVGESTDTYVIADGETVSNFDQIALYGNKVTQQQLLI